MFLCAGRRAGGGHDGHAGYLGAGVPVGAVAQGETPAAAPPPALLCCDA